MLYSRCELPWEQDIYRSSPIKFPGNLDWCRSAYKVYRKFSEINTAFHTVIDLYIGIYTGFVWHCFQAPAPQPMPNPFQQQAPAPVSSSQPMPNQARSQVPPSQEQCHRKRYMGGQLLRWYYRHVGRLVHFYTCGTQSAPTVRIFLHGISYQDFITFYHWKSNQGSYSRNIAREYDWSLFRENNGLLKKSTMD